MEEELKILLLPKDPNDGKTLLLRFVEQLVEMKHNYSQVIYYVMYTRFAESQGWKVDLLERSETGIGGIKEAIFIISGEDVYSKMKFESGAHRVQRVPTTESSGRIHTSTATVVVLPEAEEIEN